MSSPSPAPHGFRITDRDEDILLGLLESRVMQRRHITAIYFNGQDDGAKKRLQTLRAGNLICEQNPGRAVSEKANYRLTATGFEILAERGFVAKLAGVATRSISAQSMASRLDVSPLTIAHELAVLDIKAALISAFRSRPGFRVAEFWTWPALFEFSYLGRPFRPDAFIRLERVEGERKFSNVFFLEVDRGTEPQRILMGKLDAYWAYAGSPQFAKFLTGSPEGRLGFRTLFVFADDHSKGTPSPRLLNCAHWFAQDRSGGARLAWLSNHADVLRDPTGPIWIRPEEYGQAVAGSAYDCRDGGWVPRGRETPRDGFVAEKLTQRHLVPELAGDT